MNSPSNTEKKPKISSFNQQCLKEWKPSLTAGKVYIFFFVIGLASIPLGVGMLLISNDVKELIVDYTRCNRIESDKDTGIPCYVYLSNQTNVTCTCKINFTVPQDMSGSVFMYYGLTNYYQNHRRYVRSVDDLQILGILSDSNTEDCEPFSTNFDVRTNQTLPVVPCGAIANSLFNDTLTINRISNGKKTEVPLLRKGIAWSFDKNIKFQNPTSPDGSLETAFKGFTKPANWKKFIWELDTNDESNNGFQNEDLMIWMRTASLPSFKKLYSKINHTVSEFRDGLPKGTYELVVDYAYDVMTFDGTKQVFLSTTSILGTKNPFFGICFILAGCLWVTLGILFLLLHFKFGTYPKTGNQRLNSRRASSSFSL